MMMMTPDLPLLRKVIDHITAHPEQHDQKFWLKTTECGTVACVAGWTCLLNGDEPDERVAYGNHTASVIPADAPNPDARSIAYSSSVPERAKELLGLTPKEADALFDEDATFNDVLSVCHDIAARAGEEW